METRLAIVSKRDHRSFDPRPLPTEVLTAILDAGRLAGSARNRQPWRFVVAESAAARERMAQWVYAPAMVQAAPASVGIVVASQGSAMAGFDAGRAAQNMMLAAWDAGVASCPNGIAHPAAATEALGLGPTDVLVTVLSLGFPALRRDPGRRTADAWSRNARRLPLDRIVERLD